MVLVSHHQRKLLDEVRIAHLATADATATPHVIPICFAYDDPFTYSVIDEKPKQRVAMNLKRVRNILANPKVSLILDHYEEDWTKLWYLLVIGRAEFLESGIEHQKAIRLLRKKYPQYLHMSIEDRLVIKIKTIKLINWSHPRRITSYETSIEKI